MFIKQDNQNSTSLIERKAKVAMILAAAFLALGLSACGGGDTSGGGGSDNLESDPVDDPISPPPPSPPAEDPISPPPPSPPAEDPTPMPDAICEITGPDDITNTGVTSSGPHQWEVMNTGTVPLTDWESPTGISSGDFGGTGIGPKSFNNNNISISNPLNPGESGTISVGSIVVLSCPSGGGDEVFRVGAFFSNSSCELFVTLNCIP